MVVLVVVLVLVLDGGVMGVVWMGGRVLVDQGRVKAVGGGVAVGEGGGRLLYSIRGRTMLDFANHVPGVVVTGLGSSVAKACCKGIVRVSSD